MGKIVGWGEETEPVKDTPIAEIDCVALTNDAFEESSDEEVQYEGLPMTARAIEPVVESDVDDSLAVDVEMEEPIKDSGMKDAIVTTRSHEVRSHTEIICQHISKLALVSYDDWPMSYFDITDAASRSIRRLIDAGERAEQLDYFRILEEIQDVVLRQAARGVQDKERLRSPNLNSLIEFVGNKMSAQ